eukprot:COSAG02_NODE_38665_length_426_cov_1.113150_1_plen_51_part_01
MKTGFRSAALKLAQSFNPILAAVQRLPRRCSGAEPAAGGEMDGNRWSLSVR